MVMGNPNGIESNPELTEIKGWPMERIRLVPVGASALIQDTWYAPQETGMETPIRRHPAPPTLILVLTPTGWQGPPCAQSITALAFSNGLAMSLSDLQRPAVHIKSRCGHRHSADRPQIRLPPNFEIHIHPALDRHGVIGFERDVLSFNRKAAQ